MASETPSTPPTKKPLAFIQFSAAVNVEWDRMPITVYRQGYGEAPQAFIDYEREHITIGADVFPLHGGMVGHYRFARAATALKKDA